MAVDISENASMAFAKQASLTGKEKAAILFSELGVLGTKEMLKYFSTAELKKLRKALQSLPEYNYHQIPKENSVLVESLKFGMAKRLCVVSPELLTSAHYSKFHEYDASKAFLKGLSKNADAVANVLSVWLKEDK